MGFSLDSIVPWGRSYEEYVAMFDLTEAELKQRILGCGDGPAGFNAELSRRGGTIVSVDPIYVFAATQLSKRIGQTYETVLAEIRKNRAAYAWNAISSPDELGRIRMSAMRGFLSDYDAGKNSGRYIAGELPSLAFSDLVFDIALSSHFLFLYSTHLTLDFHIRAIMEMLRLAREVRVFPLLGLDGKKSPHLSPVIKQLAGKGFDLSVKRVPYEFQIGGDEMLVVRHEPSQREMQIR